MAKIYRDAEAKVKEWAPEYEEMMEERNYQAHNSPTTIEDMLVALDNENQRMAEMILALNKRIDNILISEDSDRATASGKICGRSVSTVFRNLFDQLEVMRHNRQKLGDLINRVNL